MCFCSTVLSMVPCIRNLCVWRMNACMHACLKLPSLYVRIIKEKRGSARGTILIKTNSCAFHVTGWILNWCKSMKKENVFLLFLKEWSLWWFQGIPQDFENAELKDFIYRKENGLNVSCLGRSNLKDLYFTKLSQQWIFRRKMRQSLCKCFTNVKYQTNRLLYSFY